MKHYCDYCHLSISAPSSVQNQLNDLNQEYQYLTNLYQQSETIRQKSWQIDRDIIKDNKKQYFHKSPYLVVHHNLSALTHHTANLLFCPEHFMGFDKRITSSKRFLKENQEALEKLNKIPMGHEIEGQVLSYMKTITEHFNHKLSLILDKEEKLKLKHYLLVLDKQFVNKENPDDLWAELKKNREDKKLDKFKEFKILKDQPLTPQEYLNNLPQKDLITHMEMSLTQKKITSEYEKIEEVVYNKAFIFICRYGYYWQYGQNLSKKFFLELHECYRELSRINERGFEQ